MCAPLCQWGTDNDGPTPFVAVGVVQVERLAHPVVGGAVERDAGGEHAAQRVREGGAGRVEKCHVVESGGSGRRRTAPGAFPGVEPEVVMVTPGREKHRLGAEALRDLEAEHVAVEGKGTFQIGDLEVHVSDADLGVNRCGGVRGGNGFHGMRFRRW
jgi:hypothetical protein